MNLQISSLQTIYFKLKIFFVFYLKKNTDANYVYQPKLSSPLHYYFLKTTNINICMKKCRECG